MACEWKCLTSKFLSDRWMCITYVLIRVTRTEAVINDFAATKSCSQ